MKSLACGMALTLFLQLIQSKIDLLIISDRLCLSALIFCTVSAIGISVKSHIGTSLFSLPVNIKCFLSYCLNQDQIFRLPAATKSYQ